jgi:hypothetical protein
MKYDFFWVFPRRLSANGRRFGTLYRFHLQMQVKEEFFFDLPLKMKPIQCSETSAILLCPAFEDETDTVFRNVGH